MNLPDFKHKPSRTIRDFETDEGARELARRIRKVWAEQGHTVEGRIEKQSRGSSGSVYVVRTNLINGVPAEE